MIHFRGFDVSAAALNGCVCVCVCARAVCVYVCVYPCVCAERTCASMCDGMLSCFYSLSGYM